MTSTPLLENLDQEAILEAIPHRSPFLFLDRIVTCEPGVFAQSAWHLRPDAFFLAGHFPDYPVMPGVLLLEVMAQTACFAMARAAPEPGLYLLTNVEQGSFSSQVMPGSEVLTEARLTRQVNQFSFFCCESRCHGQRVAKASLRVACKR